MPDTVIQSLHGSYLMPALEHATVADAMHPGILSCQSDATLTEVARMMATHHVHCIAVVGLAPDEAGGPSVWGTITDVDLMRAGIRSDTDLTAGSLALQPVVTVKPTTPLREAGELMLSHGVSHLVVVDTERLFPIGILSGLDVAGVLAWGEA